MLEIQTPDEIKNLLESVMLNPKQRKQLNIKLANMTRNYFRKQIAKQRDIDGQKYSPRKKRKYRIPRGGKVKINRNMFMGLSRMMQTEVTKTGFSVGLAGVAGKIALIHNEGEALVLPTRINGWFNSKTNRWQGGIKRKAAYRMPERTFIGWTEELNAKIANEILTSMETKT